MDLKLVNIRTGVFGEYYVCGRLWGAHAGVEVRTVRPLGTCQTLGNCGDIGTAGKDGLKLGPGQVVSLGQECGPCTGRWTLEG